MTTLDERYADLLDADNDPRYVHLIAELDTLREGSPSQRGDLLVRRALAVHAGELAQQVTRRAAARALPAASRLLPRRGLSLRALPFGASAGEAGPTRVGAARLQRWTRHLRVRLRASVAAALVALLSMGLYLHGQSPASVSAQTVLQRAAAAGPGSNEATHANYRLTAEGGLAGTAEVWVGYDGSGAPFELALTLTMTRDGQPAPDLSGSLIEVDPASFLRPPSTGQQVPAPKSPPPGARATSTVPAPARMLKGFMKATVLAQNLSRQADRYTSQQETLDGVPVYALQPHDAGEQTPHSPTIYFNAQSYVLEGADWVQDGSAWQARLDPTSYHTLPLSAVPASVFGSK